MFFDEAWREALTSALLSPTPGAFCLVSRVAGLAVATPSMSETTAVMKMDDFMVLIVVKGMTVYDVVKKRACEKKAYERM